VLVDFSTDEPDILAEAADEKLGSLFQADGSIVCEEPIGNVANACIGATPPIAVCVMNG
jgi:hypothetical protein